MTKLPALAALALLLATPAAAQSVPSYDDTWYRGDPPAGEYPNGFTVLEDTVLKLRPLMSSTDKTIDCPLPAKATIHPWNVERSQAMGLTFVTYSEIQEYEVTEAYEGPFYGEFDATETTLSFKPGDRFRYLIYFAEGTYLMEYEGVQYTGDQGLMEKSKQVNTAEPRRRVAPHQLPQQHVGLALPARPRDGRQNHQRSQHRRVRPRRRPRVAR